MDLEICDIKHIEQAFGHIVGGIMDCIILIANRTLSIRQRMIRSNMQWPSSRAPKNKLLPLIGLTLHMKEGMPTCQLERHFGMHKRNGITQPTQSKLLPRFILHAIRQFHNVTLQNVVQNTTRSHSTQAFWLTVWQHKDQRKNFYSQQGEEGIYLNYSGHSPYFVYTKNRVRESTNGEHLNPDPEIPLITPKDYLLEPEVPAITMMSKETVTELGKSKINSIVLSKVYLSKGSMPTANYHLSQKLAEQCWITNIDSKPEWWQ
ncbi:hypothetical protein BC830DRAFT_1080370 [Chytriomyces sp. MP71]|nr:hypothetical protein BC830DRAFT_1080370 [Chytriomyces sp. MP71]